MKRLSRRRFLMLGGALAVTAAALAVAEPRIARRLGRVARRSAYWVRDILTPRYDVAELTQPLLDPSTALLLGEGGPVVVEFLDYNCPGCRRVHREIEALRREGTALRLLVRHHPLKGEASRRAALAVLAAGPRGAAELHRRFLEWEGDLDEPAIIAVAAAVGLDSRRLLADMASAEVAARLEADRELAWSLRIVRVPSLIVEGAIHNGRRGLERLRALVSRPPWERA